MGMGDVRSVVIERRSPLKFADFPSGRDVRNLPLDWKSVNGAMGRLCRWELYGRFMNEGVSVGKFTLPKNPWTSNIVARSTDAIVSASHN